MIMMSQLKIKNTMQTITIFIQRRCQFRRSYSACDRWRNEYGELAEIYRQDKTELFSEESVPVPLSTTNVTQNDLGTNPGLCGERPATDCLSHSTTIKTWFMVHSQEYRRRSRAGQGDAGGATPTTASNPNTAGDEHSRWDKAAKV